MKANPEIEDRLRAHLAAERQAIHPPADLEARVLRRLAETPVPRKGPGMFRGPDCFRRRSGIRRRSTAGGHTRAGPDKSNPHTIGECDGLALADYLAASGDRDGIRRHGGSWQAGH